jgi:hypothetical protein
MDKPFARGLGKILGRNTLLANLYMPRAEFRKFVGILSKLLRAGQLKSYDYVIIDPVGSKRQTIAYEHFENKKWHYDHEKHIRNLEKIAKAQGLRAKATA